MAEKRTIDIERFIDEYTTSVAKVDEIIEEFTKINGLNFQALAEACAEAKDKNQLAHAFQAYFRSYTKGTKSLIKCIHGQLTESMEMLGALLSNIRDVAPGIFKEEDEPRKIGVMCVVRDENGNLKEVPLKEVAAMLPEEELARMEAEIGADAANLFREAKRKQEDD